MRASASIYLARYSRHAVAVEKSRDASGSSRDSTLDSKTGHWGMDKEPKTIAGLGNGSANLVLTLAALYHRQMTPSRL